MDIFDIRYSDFINNVEQYNSFFSESGAIERIRPFNKNSELLDKIKELNYYHLFAINVWNESCNYCIKDKRFSGLLNIGNIIDSIVFLCDELLGMIIHLYIYGVKILTRCLVEILCTLVIIVDDYINNSTSLVIQHAYDQSYTDLSFTSIQRKIDGLKEVVKDNKYYSNEERARIEDTASNLNKKARELNKTVEKNVEYEWARSLFKNLSPKSKITSKCIREKAIRILKNNGFPLFMQNDLFNEEMNQELLLVLSSVDNYHNFIHMSSYAVKEDIYQKIYSDKGYLSNYYKDSLRTLCSTLNISVLSLIHCIKQKNKKLNLSNMEYINSYYYIKSKSSLG